MSDPMPASPSTPLSRAPSIMIAPKSMPQLSMGPSLGNPTQTTNGAAATGGGGGGGTLNSLANVQPSMEKMTKFEFLAPKEEEELKTFDKTLSSDVSQEEAISLLQKVDEKTSLFREFNFHDIAYLAQVLTILKFNPGDVIIESGEESSFVGMILSGELQVRFGDVVKPIPEGSLLGELSFFEGGTRTAAVSAHTESIVAMITFNELELLGEYAPTIRLKLMVLFASEGIKKMRQFSKPPPATPDKDEKPAAATESATPYNQSKVVNKRASGTMPDGAKMSPSASQKDLTQSAATDSKVHERTRSMKRVGSLVKDALNIAPGTLNATPAPAPNERNVEALFRIRMKNEQKAQQEKIEKALEKRKKAEHKAANTTVIADAYKRNLDKKQEFIEELYQENLDLKEYKAWAQKKHIADAKFLKEKLEASAQLQTELAMETEKRRAQEKSNEELYKQIEILVNNRTKSYVDTANELREDIVKLQARLEAGEKLRATLDENLKLAAQQKQLDEARIADVLKQLEEARLQHETNTNEQHTQHTTALTALQDELTMCKGFIRQLEEKHHHLTVWKEEAIEHQLQKEMLHQRLHRHLIENVDKHSALLTDVQAYKVILKYVLASTLIKHHRRRKALQSLYLDTADMMKKLNVEVAHYNVNKAAGANGASGTTGQTITVKDQSGKKSQQQVVDMNEDGTLVLNLDDHFGASEAASNYYNSTSSASPTNNDPSNRNNPKTFAETAKTDQLFFRLNDLLPTLRTLIDEICSQKIYWNATADSFFRRTIELKQQLMDVESTTGIKLLTNSNGTGAIEENINLSLAGKTNWKLLTSPDYHANIEAANTVQRNNQFIYQESKEESNQSTTNKRSKGPSRLGTSPSTPEDDENDSKSYNRSGRRGSTHANDSKLTNGDLGAPTSMAELRDAREKMVYYKRRCKEFKETNAMLSTRVSSFAARLAELEEWQRNLYAHSNAASAAGLLNPFQLGQSGTPFPTAAFPPIPGAMQTGQPLKGGSTSAPINMKHSSVYPPHPPLASTTLGVSPTSILMTGGSLSADNPYLHPPSNGSNDRPLTTSSLRKDGSNAPVFHIKTGSSGGAQFANPTTTGVSPLNAMYASLPTSQPSITSQSNPIVLTRSAEPNYLIQQSGGNQPIYTLPTTNTNIHPYPPNGSQQIQSPSQHPPATHSHTTPSYMQHQMAAAAAHQQPRYHHPATPSTPVLVFPSTPPPHAIPGSNSARNSSTLGLPNRASYRDQ